MSRVKRAQNREDIVINRDDDGEAVPEKEGTAAESGDIGRLAMFGAPSSGGEPSTGSETAGSSEKDLEKGDLEGEIIDEDGDVSQERPSFANRRRRTQQAMERERDDNPPKNILAAGENEDEHEDRAHDHLPHHLKEEDGGLEAERPSSRASNHAKEARYCKPGQTQTWQEGRKVSLAAFPHRFVTDSAFLLSLSPSAAPLSPFLTSRSLSTTTTALMWRSLISTLLPRTPVAPTPILSNESSPSPSMSSNARSPSSLKATRPLNSTRRAPFTALRRGTSRRVTCSERPRRRCISRRRTRA